MKVMNQCQGKQQGWPAPFLGPRCNCSRATKAGCGKEHPAQGHALHPLHLSTTHLAVGVGASLQEELLCGNQLLPPPALLLCPLELRRLLCCLLLGASQLGVGSLQVLCVHGQAGPQALLAMQQVLNAQLGHPEHLQQDEVCRLPTVGAPLPIQVAERHAGNVLLEHGHIHLLGHPLHIDGTEAMPVHTGLAGLEVEGGDVYQDGESWGYLWHPHSPRYRLVQWVVNVCRKGLECKRDVLGLTPQPSSVSTAARTSLHTLQASGSRSELILHGRKQEPFLFPTHPELLSTALPNSAKKKKSASLFTIYFW